MGQKGIPRWQRRADEQHLQLANLNRDWRKELVRSALRLSSNERGDVAA
jgi:hypothetical protein